MQGLLYVIEKLGQALAQAEAENATLRQRLAEAEEAQEPEKPE